MVLGVNQRTVRRTVLAATALLAALHVAPSPAAAQEAADPTTELPAGYTDGVPVGTADGGDGAAAYVGRRRTDDHDDVGTRR